MTTDLERMMYVVNIRKQHNGFVGEQLTDYLDFDAGRIKTLPVVSVDPDMYSLMSSWNYYGKGIYRLRED